MKHKRLLSMLLVVVMTLSLLPVAAFADDAEYYYVDRYWDESSKEVVSNEVDLDPSAFMPEGSSLTLLTNGTDTFFVVGDTTLADRWTISGDIKLVIADGATLTCEKGIAVNYGASLSIYGQRNDSGKLIANSESYNAAIGSDDHYDDSGANGGGTINIYGGTINATGGRRAAGIGGGDGAGNGAIAIYGGAVTAQGGESGAGIGNGYRPATESGTITIYGGTINATGGRYAAGIGGGLGYGNGEFTIYGGTVTVQGGEGGASIGAGAYAKWEGAVKIRGGMTTLTVSARNCAFIGHGNISYGDGTLELGDNMKVYLSGTTPALAMDRADLCCSTGEQLIIAECDHPDNLYDCTEEAHWENCPYCYTTFTPEAHDFDDCRKCTICGYQGEVFTISFAAGDSGSGSMAEQIVVPGNEYILPECGFTAPEGIFFKAWSV